MGVLQGSIQGPLLFIMYTKHLPPRLYTLSSSSYTGTTTSSFVGFGLLNYILPFLPILDAVSPVFDILNPQVCHNIIFPSILLYTLSEEIIFTDDSSVSISSQNVEFPSVSQRDLSRISRWYYCQLNWS